MPRRPQGIELGASYAATLIVLILAAGLLLAWFAPDLWLYWLAW